jgi:hypothetical protein
MIDALYAIISANTGLLWSGLVAATVSAGVSYLFKRQETRYSAEIAYEYEQRKKLRELIGRYHGRLLNAANSMNYRLWNLYKNHKKGWLAVKSKYSDPGSYYFKTSVYRFMNVCALVRQLETEAVLLDARIAKKEDFVFLNYAAALHWVMTDVALFEGLAYDSFDQTDHFFSDSYREYCDACLQEGVFVSLGQFSELLRGDLRKKLMPVLRYFDGLNPNEARLRWDRLVAFHLLLLAFINSFGYERQHTDQEKFTYVAKQIGNARVLKNLADWLPRHDLGSDPEAQKIIGAAQQLEQNS